MKDEALKLALYGITKVPTLTHGVLVKLSDVEAAIKAALEQPEQEQNEFELRGKLANLKCWHRLTQKEVEDLLSFAAAQPAQEPYKGMSEYMAQATKGRVRIDPATGDVGIGTPPAAQPAPVPLAHIVGEIDHGGKVWTPAAQQEPVADGLIRDYINALLANKPDLAAKSTKRMADYVFTTPPAAQRQPLTINEITAIEEKVYMQTTHKGKPAFEYAHALIRAIEAAHGIKEKNT
jgi:hypothetical protein